MCNLLTLRTAVASGFATLFCPQVKLGVVCSFLSASAPLPGSLVLPQSSVALYSEAVGTFLAFKRLICHGEWMVSFPNPSLPGTQGDQNFVYFPSPPRPSFLTLFLNTLKFVTASFAAWTSNCMKCNKPHFRLKRVNVEDNVQDGRIWKHSVFRKCPLAIT